jgi:hypothetical protein
MERYLILSPADDPHPWFAKEELRQNGINPGDMLSVKSRVRVASEHRHNEKAQTSGVLGSVEHCEKALMRHDWTSDEGADIQQSLPMPKSKPARVLKPARMRRSNRKDSERKV